MTSLKVSVVDYGVGNLLSVCRALEASGGAVTLAATEADIRQAERLVLPGVGAFGDCMHEMKQRGLHEAVLRYVEKERPLLGICVGLQVLLSKSYEFGTHDGLGIFSGEVVHLSQVLPQNAYKIPHVGWAPLHITQKQSFLSTLQDQWFYLVHSYMTKPDDVTLVEGTYSYADATINALLRRHHILGCQFHPEKSGIAGLKFLNQFLIQSEDD